MSSNFEFENPYWSTVAEAEDRLWDFDESELNLTEAATYAILHRTMQRVDILLFFLDRLNIDHFRFQSGRLNRRKLAKVLVAQIAARNEKRRANGLDEVREVGLRAMEMTLKELFSQK